MTPPVEIHSDWNSRRVWGVLLFLAWAVYELTSQAPLGVAVLCLKLGVNDLSSAVWLRRADYHRGRAKACFWFYVAFAFLKTGLAGIATIFIVLFACTMAQENGGAKPMNPPDVFAEAVLVWIIFFSAATVCTWVGIVAAVRSSVKVWVASSLNAWRRADFFPPAPRGEINWTATMVIISMVFPALIGGYILNAIVISLAGIFPARDPPEWVIWVTLASIFMIPALSMLPAVIAIRRVVAQKFDDCWVQDAFSTMPATTDDG